MAGLRRLPPAPQLPPQSASGLPNSDALKKDIADPNDPIRAKLVGGLEAGVLELLNRVNNDGGEVYCALYELSDADLINHLTIQMNRTRQAQITKELIEIISGASAV